MSYTEFFVNNLSKYCGTSIYSILNGIVVRASHIRGETRSGVGTIEGKRGET